MERQPEPTTDDLPTKISLEEIAKAVNDGTFRQEIDEAIDYDPDLAV